MSDDQSIQLSTKEIKTITAIFRSMKVKPTYAQLHAGKFIDLAGYGSAKSGRNAFVAILNKLNVDDGGDEAPVPSTPKAAKETPAKASAKKSKKDIIMKDSVEPRTPDIKAETDDNEDNDDVFDTPKPKKKAASAKTPKKNIMKDTVEPRTSNAKADIDDDESNADVFGTPAGDIATPTAAETSPLKRAADVTLAGESPTKKTRGPNKPKVDADGNPIPKKARAPRKKKVAEVEKDEEVDVKDEEKDAEVLAKSKNAVDALLD